MNRHPMPPQNDGMRRHSRENREPHTLEEISVTVWLTPENASFFLRDGFLYIRLNGTEKRAFLCRAFPFELLTEYLSVLDEEQQEIGLIRDVELFGDEERKLLLTELQRRYYEPVIDRILSVKERYGFSYWKVHTPEGEVSFTLHDTYRSIIHVSDKRLIFLDVEGNRFELPDVNTLDKKSYRKIELYL